MAFREHEGFRIIRDEGVRRPKGVPRKRKLKADGGFVRGDLTPAKVERAIWLTPRFRDETIHEIRDHLRN